MKIGILGSAVHYPTVRQDVSSCLINGYVSSMPVACDRMEQRRTGR